MRRICIILTTLFVFAATSSFSQGTVKWAKPQKSSMFKVMTGFTVIGQDDNAIYVKPKYNVFSELIKCNPKTMTMMAVPYSLKGANGKRDLEFVVMLKGELYLFSSLQDKKAKKHILYMQTVNKSTLKLNTTLTKILEVSYVGESDRKPAIFYYDISPDKSKLLVSYAVIDKNRTLLRSGFSVLDDECKTIWEENGISSGLDARFHFIEFIVDNAANVYFQGNTTYDKKELKQGAKNESYVILCLEKERTPVPIKMELAGSREFVSQTIAINDKSELYFVGTFTKDDMRNILGIYSAKINLAKQEIDNKQTFDFSEEFLTKGMKESDAKSVRNKLQKGNDFESYFYNLSDIEFLDNGSFAIGIEKSYYVVYRSRDGSTTTIHHYGDIVVANFKQDASMNWIEKIPRELSLPNFPLGSFGLITNNNNIHLLYNNMKSSAAILGVPPNKAKLIMYSLNADGESSWKELYDSKDEKIVPRPWEIIYSKEDNEIVLMGHKGSKTLSFTKVKLK